MSHPGGAPRPFTIAATSEDGTAGMTEDTYTHYSLFISLVSCFHVVAPGDYVPYVDSPLVFQQSDLSVCHRVLINQDDVCEIDPNERFSSRLRYIDGIMPIVIQPALTEVVIDDTNEPECGK